MKESVLNLFVAFWGPFFLDLFKAILLRFTLVNHHETHIKPPFGRIFWELVSKHRIKQIQEVKPKFLPKSVTTKTGWQFENSPPEWAHLT